MYSGWPVESRNRDVELFFWLCQIVERQIKTSCLGCGGRCDCQDGFHPERVQGHQGSTVCPRGLVNLCKLSLLCKLD